MKKILLGILITYMFQYSLSLLYTYRWETELDTTCHYSKVGRSLEDRFDCVDMNMPILKPLANVLLSRPVYEQMGKNNGKLKFRR